jgi:hypothetical protein
MDNYELLAINDLYGPTGVVKYQVQAHGRFIIETRMFTMLRYPIVKSYVGIAIS